MEVAFSHWSASSPVLICYLVVAVAHVAGLLRLLSGSATSPPDSMAIVLPHGATRQQLRREGLLFQLGLLIVLLALVSPIGYWSDVYIWVRAVQKLVIAVAGPGLIVLGAPWLALAQSVRPRHKLSGQADERAARMSRPARSPWSLVQPLLWVIAFNAVWLVWQLPVLFDPVRGNGAVALAEHASYVAAGIMFWLQLSGSRPLTPQMAPLRRVKMVVGTVITTTLLGMVLVFGSHVLYPVYAAGTAHNIMTVLDDQQLAGAVLWMGMLPALIVACVALLLKWFDNEESADLSAGLDRLVSPRKSAWPSRPVIR